MESMCTVMAEEKFYGEASFKNPNIFYDRIKTEFFFCLLYGLPISFIEL